MNFLSSAVVNLVRRPQAFRCFASNAFKSNHFINRQTNLLQSKISYKIEPVRFCSKKAVDTACQPQKKIVGYWLLGCSGMVFVAVVLGGVLITYLIVLLSILLVMEKIVALTRK